MPHIATLNSRTEIIQIAIQLVNPNHMSFVQLHHFGLFYIFLGMFFAFVMFACSKWRMSGMI